MMAETKKRKNEAISDSNEATENSDIQSKIPGAGRHAPAAADKPSPDNVATWLHILLDPAMNREPEEFYLERNILRKYRETVPEYSKAAKSWPLYAVQYWDTVGPIVKQLFARPFNFMQWALEYARETYPDIYGPQSSSNDAILDLTDVLYDRTFSPLHISAALGLEQVCLELMEKPSAPGVMFKERAASPLFCSLAGPQIFTCGTSMEKWHQVIHLQYPELRSRLPVIRKLLELHRQGRISYESTGRKGRLLMFLAFRATVLTGDHSLLKLVLQGGGDVRAVIDLINDDEFSYYQPADSAITSKILSSILDLVLAPSKLKLFERDRQALIDAIQDAFLLNGGARTTSGKVDITDAEFQEALKDAFLDDSIICFRRLIHHPSFDPNAPSPTGLENGTLLHHAVCDGLVEFADVIVEAGGNLDARDHKGRTPLLLCNDTESLAMLVKEHGAKTTAVDHEGRNIWHYAAATNDVPMLMWLAGHDSCKLENLKATTKDNATPMDLAMKSGLESLDANDKTRLDATIVLQVLLSNDAPHAEEVEGMSAEVAIAKILKSQPRPGGDSHSHTVIGNLLRDSFA
ncbi:hypothetical protein NLG97_g3983 [Lecanicillium saksenae]|uniref:Uncharacterized protein n=1 Tax=Lecanicillium saksenae TaxID=468837 RepID=A0ACC1QXS4_9HYPO|nr:hypothetical protein NLG97_g3983 [Lecanicillium saksenae]